MRSSLFPFDLPVLRFEEVFHVGTLDQSHKGSVHAHSYEGSGLSVSMHPEGWTCIARLGGHPTWRLTPPADAVFLDAHALAGRERVAVVSWAVERGYLRTAEHFEVSWFDSEHDCRRSMLVERRDSAEAEAEDLEDQDARVRPCLVHCATPAMVARCGFDPGPSNAEEIALTFLAEDLGIHGVWWDDELNVDALSAPRGVIHASVLSLWSRECVLQPEDSARVGRRRGPGL